MNKSKPSFSEYNQYFYHSDHLSSASFITDATGYVDQHIQYLPFGELFISQRNSTFDSRYKFTAKELDNETNYTYFGARYYDSDLSIWLSVDPLAQERSWLSPYNYCQLNPIGRIDPTGALDSEHVDPLGNIIASYDDGDNSVYMHSSGTTQSQIDQQRTTMNNTGGSGQKIGELGGNIDVSLIMNNKLDQSSQEAKKMGITEYFFAVKPGGKWDLKANKTTIFGKAWEFDESFYKNTTFSFGDNKGLNAADVGNYHGGYTGRYTYNGAGMPYGLLQWGAGAAESAKSLGAGRLGDFVLQIPQLLGGPTGPYPPYGDRMRDFVFNTLGMIDADKNKLSKANKGITR